MPPLLLFVTLLAQAAPAETVADPWSDRLAAVIGEGFAPAAAMRFSSDGSHLAYLTVDAKGRNVLFVDGEEQKPHDYVNLPVFSADGTHLAWSAGDRVNDKIEKWYAYLDGKKQKKFEWAGPVVMDAAGKQTAYWAGKGVKLSKDGWYRGGEYHLILGKKKVAEVRQSPEWAPALSPDGSEVAWSVLTDRYQVMRGKDEFGPYLWTSGLTWSADSSTLAWQAADGANLGAGFGQGPMPGAIYVNGIAHGQDYQSVAAPALGPQGKRLAFVALKDEQVLVVVNGKEWASRWDLAGTPVFDASGEHLAVCVNRGMKRSENGMPMLDTGWLDGSDYAVIDPVTGQTVLQQAKGECFLLVDDKQVGQACRRAIGPVWSPQGEVVAYRAEYEDGWKIVVGEQASEIYDELTAPVFSPDGRHVGFGARSGRDIWWKVLTVRSDSP